jgi:hypothetical protein
MPPRAAVVFGALALAASPAASQDRPPAGRTGGPLPYLASGETYPLWSIGLSLPVSARR